MKLTKNEISILNAMRTNEYQDALQDGGTWTFTAVDNSGLTEKVGRGVISSLVKKGLVTVYGDYNNVKDNTGSINFTMAGKELFDNADGEKCPWGGQPLLKTLEEVEVPQPKKSTKKATTKKVKMYTFTGMEIQGEYEATYKDGSYTVETKKGILTFDKNGKQTNSKNPKFSNTIKF